MIRMAQSVSCRLQTWRFTWRPKNSSISWLSISCIDRLLTTLSLSLSLLLVRSSVLLLFAPHVAQNRDGSYPTRRLQEATRSSLSPMNHGFTLYIYVYTYLYIHMYFEYLYISFLSSIIHCIERIKHEWCRAPSSSLRWWDDEQRCTDGLVTAFACRTWKQYLTYMVVCW